MNYRELWKEEWKWQINDKAAVIKIVCGEQWEVKLIGQRWHIKKLISQQKHIIQILPNQINITLSLIIN